MTVPWRHWRAVIVLLVATHADCTKALAAEPNDDEITGDVRTVLDSGRVQRATRGGDGAGRCRPRGGRSARFRARQAGAHPHRGCGRQEVEITSGHARRGGFFGLPLHSQFRPLIADPRWPDFSAAYQYSISDQFTNVAAVSMGETFGLVRYSLANGDLLELGVQGGVL